MSKLILIGALISACLAFSNYNMFNGEEYQAMTGVAKMNLMWPYIIADQTPGTFYTWRELLFVVESMDVTLDYVSDQLPEFRSKLIHTVGVIGQVSLQPIQGQPFTGIFNGAQNGLLRLSLAHSFKVETADEQTAQGALGNFVPGLSLKLFRDGRSSANMVSMFGVGGQASWNYFKNNFTNHIPAPSGVELDAVAHIFAKGTEYIQYIGLKDWGTYDAQGTFYNTTNYPFELRWVPNPNYSSNYSDNYDPNNNWAQQCMNIQIGDIIYTLYAKADPTVDQYVPVANIVANSNFNYSVFGDTVFFIQHNRMRYDVDEHPDWAQYLQTWSVLRNLRETDSKDSDSNKAEGCPFLN